MQTHVTALAFSIRRSWLVRAAGALLAIGAMAAVPAPAHAAVYVSVNIAPPILPVYEQPILPGPGYLWTPGYWAWSGDGYYWVPGTWVLPPFVGGLWTPGYWGWGNGLYVFHRGYWGRHVGFYGGINYGYGYGGHGYDGGYWRGSGFYYNRSVNRVGVNARNVYNQTVVNHTTIINNRRTSFNGGPGGIAARATSQQVSWGREKHSGPNSAQLRQRDMASHVQSLRASVNHGAPPIAATARAGAFHAEGMVAARGAPTAMTSRAAHEARSAPATAARHDDGMRSASFAPHAPQSTRSDSAGRYQPSPRERSRATPDEVSASQRGNASREQRGDAYRQQDNAQAPRFQPQADRQAPNQARGTNRPVDARHAAPRASVEKRRAVPANHEKRRDDQH
ncbi:MAG: hypothetical protein ABI386_06415 [Rhodanobacter sp.]